MPGSTLEVENPVKRSGSVRSERSDSSQKRVSFNRDVHVKRIPRGAAVVDGRLLPLPVRREKTSRSQRDLVKEAEKILEQVNNVRCTASSAPFSYDTKSLDRPSRQRKNNYSTGSLERRRTRNLPSEARKNRLDIKNIINSANNSRNLHVPNETIDDSSLERRKKLSPIIESPPREDYFHSKNVNRDTGKDSRKDTGKDMMMRPATLHSSQTPAAKPPLTRSNVNVIVQQLNEEAKHRELIRKQLEDEGYDLTPRVSPLVMVTPGDENSHNNNLPFSYTGPPLRKKSPPPGLAKNHSPTADYNLKSPTEVIYAQVVVNSRGEEGSSKQTVHTSVPTRSQNIDNKHRQDEENVPNGKYFSDEDEGLELGMDYRGGRYSSNNTHYLGASNGGYHKNSHTRIHNNGLTAKILVNGNGSSSISNGYSESPLHYRSTHNVTRVTLNGHDEDDSYLGSLHSPLSRSLPEKYYFGANMETEHEVPTSRTYLGEKQGQNYSRYNHRETSALNGHVNGFSSTKLVREAEKRRETDLPASSVLIRHWAPNSSRDVKLHPVDEKPRNTATLQVRKEKRETTARHERKANGDVFRKEKPPITATPVKEKKPEKKEKKKRKIKIIFTREKKEDVRENVDPLSRYTEYRGKEEGKNTSVSGSYKSSGYKSVSEAGSGSPKRNGVHQETVSTKNKEDKIRRQRRQFLSAFLSRREAETHRDTSDSEELQRMGPRELDQDLEKFEKPWSQKEDMDADYRRELATTKSHLSDAEESKRKSSVESAENSNKSAATLSRVEINNKKNKPESHSWFKSLDRLGGRKKKKEKEEREKTPSPARNGGQNVAHDGKKNLRFFGDTDQESVVGSVSKVSNHRYEPGPNKNKVGRTSSGAAGVRRELLLKSNNNQAQQNGHGSSESDATEGSSMQSQRSVYLHAATVGDIPPSTGLNKRRALSREELSSQGGLQQQTRTLSRSISVLAPWKPRHIREPYELHYDNKQTQSKASSSGKPPRAPKSRRDARSHKSASVESLRMVRETPVPPANDKKRPPPDKKKRPTVSRSASMPKDSRLAGWFRRKKPVKEGNTNNL